MCQWKEKDLSYVVNIEEVVSGVLYPGKYNLKYRHSCLTKPSNVIFEVPSKVILAISEINGRDIQLAGLMCEHWGWPIDKLINVKDSIVRFCNQKKINIQKIIDGSRECSSDSDCDYISYMPSWNNNSQCHHFVNKNSIAKINREIKISETSVCAMNTAALCKAPRKDFIKCLKKRCAFPVP
jgi:hypothetical protein